MSATLDHCRLAAEASACSPGNNNVIVPWDGRGIANDGQPYENSYAWFLKMRDRKVIDGTALFDSISFNEL